MPRVRNSWKTHAVRYHFPRRTDSMVWRREVCMSTGRRRCRSRRWWNASWRRRSNVLGLWEGSHYWWMQRVLQCWSMLYLIVLSSVTRSTSSIPWMLALSGSLIGHSPNLEPSTSRTIMPPDHLISVVHALGTRYTDGSSTTWCLDKCWHLLTHLQTMPYDIMVHITHSYHTPHIHSCGFLPYMFPIPLPFQV